MTHSPSSPRRRPTRRQFEVLRAYIAAGSIAVAAHELGISETMVRQHLSWLYRRIGCPNAAQAAYWLGTRRLDARSNPACGAGWRGAPSRPQLRDMPSAGHRLPDPLGEA